MSKINSLRRSLLLALVVAAGIAAAWCTVILWSGLILSRAVQTGDAHENLYTDVEGEPVIVRMTRSTNATESVLTLSGEPKQLTTQDLLYPLYDYLYWSRTADWHTRVQGANDGGLPSVYWYLLHDGRPNGKAYGVGFHSRKKTLVGYFSRQGFSEGRPPRDEWFDVPGERGLAAVTTLRWGAQEPVHDAGAHPFFLLANGKLWRIDVAHRELKATLDCPQATGVGQVWQIVAERPPVPRGAYPPSAQGITPQLSLVRQPESVLVVDPVTESSTSYPLPPSIRRATLAGTLLPDGQLLLFARRSLQDNEYDVVWISRDGSVARQQHLRLATWAPQWSLAATGWVGAVAVPIPVANVAFQAILPRTLLDSGKAESYSSGLGTVLSTNWPSMIAVVVASIASAVAAYRRQRRFALPYAAVWAVFAFLLGIPGWIAYRFHRAWPVLEECPACHQPSPRDREECIDCGADFPPPPLKGIEVFA